MQQTHTVHTVYMFDVHIKITHTQQFHQLEFKSREFLLLIVFYAGAVFAN